MLPAWAGAMPKGENPGWKNIGGGSLYFRQDTADGSIAWETNPNLRILKRRDCVSSKNTLTKYNRKLSFHPLTGSESNFLSQRKEEERYSYTLIVDGGEVKVSCINPRYSLDGIYNDQQLTQIAVKKNIENLQPTLEKYPFDQKIRMLINAVNKHGEAALFPETLSSQISIDGAREKFFERLQEKLDPILDMGMTLDHIDEHIAKILEVFKPILSEENSEIIRNIWTLQIVNDLYEKNRLMPYGVSDKEYADWIFASRDGVLTQMLIAYELERIHLYEFPLLITSGNVQGTFTFSQEREETNVVLARETNSYQRDTTKPPEYISVRRSGSFWHPNITLALETSAHQPPTLVYDMQLAIPQAHIIDLIRNPDHRGWERVFSVFPLRRQ